MAYDPNEPRNERGEWSPAAGGGGGWQAARVSIRPKVFRDKQGFGISGKDTRGRSVSIFTESRSSAEHIKGKLQKGFNIDSPDFAARTEAPAHDAHPINGATGKPRRSR